MSHSLPPVLLTSCVYVADSGSVNLSKPEDRIHHTLESVGKWLLTFPHLKLVICDSSNFDFSPLAKAHFPKANIECIFFAADKELVKFHGKGFGEGEIVRYALTHSSLLNEASYFAKCTAKLWVENFEACLSEWNGSFLCRGSFKNVFSLKKTLLDHIDTRFYLASREFYNKYLLDAHINLGGESGLGIEESFRDIVLKNNLHGIIFRIPPLIGGVGGGTGKYYNIRRSKKLKEYLRYWLLRHIPRWKHLFNQAQNSQANSSLP